MNFRDGDQQSTKDFKFEQELTVTKTEFKSLTDKPDFEAQFNEEVSWKLRLIGLTSGAVQEFNGLSKGFDANGLVVQHYCGAGRAQTG